MSVIRGTASDAFVTDIAAYTVAAYNRLAALVHGRLQYPYAGRGIYIFDFVVFNNTLDRALGLRAAMNWPGFLEVWQSEFGATWAAGLNGNSIFSGAFGYIFAELGWFSPLLLFGYGMLYGCVWRRFRMGGTIGVVLYPWFAFCILFWFGTNYLFDNKALVLFIDALLLLGYERLGTKLKATPAGMRCDP